MRNILLEKSYTKCGREASPRPFYKKSKLSNLWIKMFAYIVCPNRDYQLLPYIMLF